MSLARNPVWNTDRPLGIAGCGAYVTVCSIVGTHITIWSLYSSLTKTNEVAFSQWNYVAGGKYWLMMITVCTVISASGIFHYQPITKALVLH